MKAKLKRRIFGKFIFIAGDTCKVASVVVPQSFGIDRLHLGIHIKKTGPPGYSVCFQGRRNSQTDGLLRPAFIRNHQMCLERIQTALHTLH